MRHQSFMIPRGLMAAVLALALCGCTVVQSSRNAQQSLYDLGYAGAGAAAPQAKPGPLPALSVAEVSAPAWMDTTRMFYRLNYDDPLEARTYATSRWTMPPSRLFLQRLKTRLGEAGGAVLGASDGAVGIPQLRVEADDFSHVFTTASDSFARVVVRASLLQDRRLVAQRSFSATAPAGSPDAGGGVKALAQASDAVIADIITWLAGVPLNR